MFFIGCYTRGAGGDGTGITLVERDRSSGALRGTATVAVTASPSFLARHPVAPVLYAANELSPGLVSTFRVDPVPAVVDSRPSGGSEPCHLSVDSAGRHLYVANYASGTVGVFELDDDGVPMRQSDVVEHSGRGPHPQKQAGPHAHTVLPTDGGVVSVDLGTDSVLFHPLDPATGELGEPEVAVQARPGSGPRQLATGRDGRVYLVGELDGSVTAYERGSDGWREVSRVTASVSPGAQPSEIAVSGRYLYVANRGPDTLAVFELPALTRIGEVSTGGRWPRHFALHDEYLYVANQLSHTVVTLRIDPGTGLPFPTGNMLPTPSPTCILPWS